MKAIKCEMCESNDVIKQGDFYVCQHCGTKYETEAAKKLMVEVDTSAPLEKALQNARRAKEKEDWEECEKYYNLAEQYDPSNIEAIFYSSYGKARQSLSDSDIFKRQAAFKPLTNGISMLGENFEHDKETEELSMLNKISDDLAILTNSSFVYTQKKNGYGIVTSTDTGKTRTLFSTLHLTFAAEMEEIAATVKDNEHLEKLYELAIIHYRLAELQGASKDSCQAKIKAGIEKIKAFAPEKAAELDEKYGTAMNTSHVDSDKAKKNSSSMVGCITFIIIFAILSVITWAIANIM